MPDIDLPKETNVNSEVATNDEVFRNTLANDTLEDDGLSQMLYLEGSKQLVNMSMTDILDL